MKLSHIRNAAILTVALNAGAALADQEEDLAMQLANPVASLISVPIEVDLDSKLGPGRNCCSQWQNVVDDFTVLGSGACLAR